METIEIIDVTLLEPKLKHPTIFQCFDALQEGDAFIINNDHDPAPLYYQLLAERGEIFTWDYLMKGPETWKVQIGKKILATKEPTIGQMVTKDFRKAEVFKKYGIDFCCGGKKSLAKACEEKGLDKNTVDRELNQIASDALLPSQNYAMCDADFLADYIFNTHHRYVTQSIPVLFQYIQKVANVHGDKHPQTILIRDIFLEVANELNSHMMKEENILFPYIKKLAAAVRENQKTEIHSFGSVSNPIQRMEEEHTEVGDQMEKIMELTNNYTPPAGACTTFKVSYAKLKEFSDDLHQHIHLENNILFPKALELELNIQAL